MALLAGKKYVGPRGSTSAKIMVVGEAPGANEERLGQPFVGAAGQLLEEMLAATGSNPADVFFTNLARYRPPNNELRAWFSKDGVPNDIILGGLEELSAEIEAIKPNVIVPLGNYPNALLTGNARWDKKNGFTGISDYRGYVVPGNDLARGIKCVPTYHPANVTREYTNKPVAKFDLRRAAHESTFSDLRRPRKFFILDPRGVERQDWIDWLVSPTGTLSPPFSWNRGTPVSGGIETQIRVPSGPFLSADIEYPGNKLVCCGLTRHPDVGVTLSTYNEKDRHELSLVLRSGIPLAWQNGMFDASILHWHYGIDCYPYIVHDTFLMMHTVYTEMPRDLGFIASYNDNPPPWWQKIDSKWWKALGAGQVPFNDLLEYNAYDHTQTLEAAYRLLNNELDPEGVWRKTYEFEMSLVYPLYKISRRGVRIDTKKLKILRDTLEQEVKDFNYGLALLNNKPLNVRSGPEVQEFLLNKLKIPSYLFPEAPSSSAKKRVYSFGDKNLAAAQLKCQNDTQRQAIRLVRETRERANLISKFCDIDLDDDGRMRCHYDPGKTQTRRLASRQFYPTGRGANLQNIPKDNRVRGVFIPDDGYVFGYADLKSAESLVVAHLSGDPEMLRLHSPEFMSGGRDGHKFVAAFLFDKHIDSITPEERYIGKRTRHACNYMLGWMKLMQYINADADVTGVSINAAAAKEIVRKYRQFHPLLVQWWGEIERELGENNGRLYDCFGNPHQFNGRKEEILPNAVAFKPQGTIGVGLNYGLLRVDAHEELASLDFQILLQVHDAIGFQVPLENAARAIPPLVECLTTDVPIKRRGVEDYTIQIPVDTKLGLNWGEREFDKETKEWVNPDGLRDWQTWLKEAA